ncbi:MAG: TetR/AcrR family transcriptional regulator [Deltaproteobacteria bacterium]|nr:TetR/AcrR family transcriptional regulator [Deltaproteobacteria bacterium]
MRADARRNRERLLDAAIQLILEGGREPTRDALAAHAGVGIGTVYRHFPDPPSLLHAVVRFALERSIEAGEDALATSPSAFDAIRKYMHAAVDHGIGVVNLLYPRLERPHPDLRTRAEALIRTMIERGKHEGRLPPDASPGDIVFATIRFGRPLAVGLSAADERALAHRHIDLYLDGLGGRSRAPAPRAKRSTGVGRAKSSRVPAANAIEDQET